MSKRIRAKEWEKDWKGAKGNERLKKKENSERTQRKEWAKEREKGETDGDEAKYLMSKKSKRKRKWNSK